MAERALHIIKVEFKFPALLTKDEADNQFLIDRLAKEVMDDSYDIPFDIMEAAPRYEAPDGYDDDIGIYTGVRDEFVSWREAVEADKARRATMPPCTSTSTPQSDT